MPITQATSFVEAAFGRLVPGIVVENKSYTKNHYGSCPTALGAGLGTEQVSRIRLEMSCRGTGLTIQSACLNQGHRSGHFALRRVSCELESRGSDSLAETSSSGTFSQRLSISDPAQQGPRMSLQATSSPSQTSVSTNTEQPSTSSSGPDARTAAGSTVLDPFAVGPLNVGSQRFVSDEAIQAELLKKQSMRGVTFGDTGRGPPTSTQPATLVLMRHGESMWNDLKLFTGDVDIPLTEKGALEAMEGGRAVAMIDFDMIFTSRLIRSKQTALLAMTQSKHKRVPVIVRGGFMGKGKTGDENRLRLREAAWHALQRAECRMIPVYADPALNERCYGHLQGLNKEEAAKEFGKEMVDRWRRSHNTSPPGGESLLDTWERCVSFFQGTIEPRLQEGNNVLVVAHGNVLRCIIAYLAGLSTLEMLRLQVFLSPAQNAFLSPAQHNTFLYSATSCLCLLKKATYQPLTTVI
eukprot:TRINITY_DN8126_c0_g1_i1.p1 TRINITY_DN8126_c0_g1~~TRINITY_DN8126_c0_g1_i1.p1  ORF type:complete len:466 (+),score=81.89 TRINITY_DN8126_c0_g1_i1:116-1513(+)